VVECLLEVRFIGTRAADLSQNRFGRQVAYPALGVGNQLDEGQALVVMGDRSTRGPPQPLANLFGSLLRSLGPRHGAARVGRRCVGDDAQLLAQRHG
jgi:hypothetical protein